MVPVFVDTGGWIAMSVARDQFHRRAASYYRKISKKNVPLLTSNYILVETYTRIRYDDGHAKAVQFDSVIQEAIKIGRLHLEWVTPAIHQEAWKNFESFSDQVFSFVDCSSFVIARNIGVVEVFGFDEHFKTMGFTLRP